MNTEFIKELSSLLNRCLCTAVFAGVILYSAVNIGPIASFLADRFDSLQALKFAGAELTFDAQNIHADERLFDIKDLTRDTSRKIAQDIEQMNAPLMKRLIFVESLKGLCKYNTKNWRAEQAAALDDQLEALGLATIEDDPDTKALVDSRIRKGDQYAPSEDLGVPLRCYKMTLTAEGANVRDVLVAKMVERVTARTTDEPATPRESVVPAPTTPHPVTTAKPTRAAGPKIAMRRG
jgi:hypothetical protein